MTAAEQVRDDPYECGHCHEAVVTRWGGDPAAAVGTLLGVDARTAGYLLALNHLFPSGTALRDAHGRAWSVLAGARHLAGVYSMTLDAQLLEELLAAPGPAGETSDAVVDWRSTVRRLPPPEGSVDPERVAS